MGQTTNNKNNLTESLFLLTSVVEQIKLPILQIQKMLDLGIEEDLSTAKSIADYTLRLLDNYAMSLKLNSQMLKLDSEPVSVAAVLYDSGQSLDDLAKQYGVKLEINVTGRYEPVFVHRQALQAAIVSLGGALIECQGSLAQSKMVLKLASHRCRYGIVAGVYSEELNTSSAILRQGRGLYGRARQPLTAISNTAGAGIFVADSLLKAMNLDLKASRHHNLKGLGAVLRPSSQLLLVG